MQHILSMLQNIKVVGCAPNSTQLYTSPSVGVLCDLSKISKVALGALVGRVVGGDPRSKQADGGWLPTLPGNRAHRATSPPPAPARLLLVSSF